MGFRGALAGTTPRPSSSSSSSTVTLEALSGRHLQQDSEQREGVLEYPALEAAGGPSLFDFIHLPWSLSPQFCGLLSYHLKWINNILLIYVVYEAFF